MENTTKFNEEAGLKVIYAMIETARNDVRNNYFFYLLWGFLVFAACLLEFSLFRFFHYRHHYIGWPVLMGLGMIVSIIYSIRRFGGSSGSSYVGIFMMYFFGGWSISFFVLFFFIYPGSIRLIQPLSLVMYALATFVSGGALRFRPLIWGGMLSWIAAVIAFYSPFHIQLLISAGTVMLAYIIPGYLLRRKSLLN